MAFYCVVMLDIALELAAVKSDYESEASKFLEHFVAVTEAMENVGGKIGDSFWNEEDGFYYDHIRLKCFINQDVGRDFVQGFLI